jgi:fatty-acyl-CoA synthase
MQATGSSHDLSLRKADFSTLCDALDYAAQGETGVNFHNARGELYASVGYGELREQAIALARRLMGLGIERGGRVALVAETSPHFVRFFWACQYAGLVPVPLPATIQIGGHAAYVAQLAQLIRNCGAAAAMATAEWSDFLQEAVAGMDLAFSGTPETFDALPEAAGDLPGVTPESTAYIQYTSGSTRFPRGVVIDQKTVLANIRDMAENGLKLHEGDRFSSWLPFYHDMGLVAFIIMPMATQRSVDFLGTHDFAMRPRKWLEMMSANRATITSAPPFAYELAVMRVRERDAEGLDLSALRVACVGAEMISPEPLERFAEVLARPGSARRRSCPATAWRNARSGSASCRSRRRCASTLSIPRRCSTPASPARSTPPRRGPRAVSRATWIAGRCCPRSRSRSATRPALSCRNGMRASSTCAGPA